MSIVSTIWFWIFMLHFVNLFTAEVTTASGKKHLPKLCDNRDESVTIAYEPTEIGLHQLDVRYNQLPVYGSPFRFYVHGPRWGQVIAFGPGLSHGISHNPCHFTIITKDAGAGKINFWWWNTSMLTAGEIAMLWHCRIPWFYCVFLGGSTETAQIWP